MNKPILDKDITTLFFHKKLDTARYFCEPNFVGIWCSFVWHTDKDFNIIDKKCNSLTLIKDTFFSNCLGLKGTRIEGVLVMSKGDKQLTSNEITDVCNSGSIDTDVYTVQFMCFDIVSFNGNTLENLTLKTRKIALEDCLVYLDSFTNGEYYKSIKLVLPMYANNPAILLKHKDGIILKEYNGYKKDKIYLIK